LKLIFIFAAIIAALWFYFTRNQGSDGTIPGIEIPDVIAPVVTDQSCVGKTDAQGNWYGVNFSGNCTVEALGGASGDY
jgi:hypothetical protein